MASRNARSVPGVNEGSADKGNGSSLNRSEGVHDALMWRQRVVEAAGIKDDAAPDGRGYVTFNIAVD